MAEKPADKKPETAPVDPHVSGDAGAHPLHGLDNDEIATRAIRPPGSGTDPFKPAAADPHVQPAPKPEPESPFAAMLRRVREANGERITTTKAQWARVCADETADPMQLLEMHHLVDQLDIYIVDR